MAWSSNSRSFPTCKLTIPLRHAEPRAAFLRKDVGMQALWWEGHEVKLEAL